MSVRVSDIMKLPLLHNATLVGGASGSARPIESVNVMDAPDIAQWVKPNQFILTTAYVIKDDVAAQVNLIRQLHAHHCAGLAIKTKRFLEHLPPSLIAEADAHAFPLIELPAELSLGDIMNHLLSLVLNNKQYQLEQAFEAHRRFTSLFLTGGEMRHVAQALSALLKLPVAILNPACKLIGSSSPFPKTRFTRDIWPHLQAYLFEHRVNEHTLTPLTFDSEAQSTCSLYPVSTGTLLRGYIVLLPEAEPGEQSSRDIPLMFLEQAANVIAYESIKQEALHMGEKRVREQFFSEFLDGRLPIGDGTRARFDRYGLHATRPHALIAVYPHQEALEATGDISRQKQRETRELLINQIETYLQTLNYGSVAINRTDHIAVLLEPAEGAELPNETRLLELLTDLQQALKCGSAATACSLGLGNPAHQLDRIPQAYREALGAVRTAVEQGRLNVIRSHRTEEVQELLRFIPPDKMQQFCRSTLKELAFAEEPELQDLLETLDVYLRCNAQVTETAKALFIHRNSAHYRIQKCEQLLQVSLKDPVEASKLRIALLIYRLLQEPQRTP